MKQEYCRVCGSALGTSLTSCACGWRMLDPMPRQDVALPPPVGYVTKAEHDRIVAEKDAEVAEMTRRRNEWRKKAEGYDAVRLALREKVGSPWPPHMSRILWAGIAADEKKRADDADAEIARLTEKADRTDFAEAQLQALLDMLPPPEPGMLLKRLKERAAQRALAEKE